MTEPRVLAKMDPEVGDLRPRIVSLIASATEIACALGLRNYLVGRSHECDYPPDVVRLPQLSSPKVDPALAGPDIDRAVREIVRDGLSVYRIDVDALEKIEPDIILTQDHCEVCAVSLSDVKDALCQLTKTNAEICTLHPEHLDDVRASFRAVANIVGVAERGERLVTAFDERLRVVGERVAGRPKPRIALVEWMAPPMVAGGWMPELAVIAGTDPVIVDSPKAFVQVSWEDIAAADPDIVVITPCGYTVERTLEEMQDREVQSGLNAIRAVHAGKCVVTDGNAYFNRPGPRLADSAEILAAIAHPDAVPDWVERFASAISRKSPATS